jgi:hypothetical protein
MRFYLATLLASLPMFGFFAALLTRGIYGGTLSDPGGIPSLRITVRKRQALIDLNLVAEIAGVFTVAALVAMFHGAGPSR